MKTTISRGEFHRAFKEIRPDNFSHEGRNALFDWCEDYEQSTGEEYELDVIALCCEVSEDGYQAIADDYNIEMPERDEDQDDADYEAACIEAVRDYLDENTDIVAELAGGVFLYQVF